MSIIETLRDPQSLPFILGIISFLIIVVFWVGLIEDTSADRRIRMLERRRTDLRNELISNRRSKEATALAKNVVDKFNLNKGDGVKGAALDLIQAGLRSKDAVPVYLFMQLIMPVVGFVIGFSLFFVFSVWDADRSKLWLATAVFAAIFGLAPGFYVRRRKKKRLKNVFRSLPDGLDLFVICAEAGLSLDSTFERVSQEIMESHPDLADEFGLTAVELGFMPERTRALQALAERCPLPGIVALVSTLVQTERYGTPLAVAMRVLSAELRNERMMKAEEKAARLPAVMTVPMILFILPPLFIVLLGPSIIISYEAFGQ